MDVSFSAPQRQSPVGVLVLFFYALQKNARAFWPLIVVYAFKFKELNILYLVTGIVLFLLLIGVISYLKYRSFTFFLDAEKDEFIISDGILNKTKTAIQLDKIQQVNINQSFIQKLIGVYELHVDTAGSSKKEGHIKAISHEVALELKSRLLDQSALKTSQDLDINSNLADKEAEVTEAPFVTIGLLSLLKLGITSNYGKTIGLIIIFGSTIYENFRKFSESDSVYQEQVNSYVDKGLASQSLVIGFVFVLAGVLVLNIARVIIQYYGYTIARQKNSMLLSYGLFNSKSTILKPEKVQIITIKRNFFQKKLGILELRIRQATSGTAEDRKSIIEIPGCSDLESSSVLQLLYDQIPEKGLALKPNFRVLAVALLLYILVPVLLFYVIGAWLEPAAFDFVYLVPVYVIFIGLLQYFKFKNNRLFIHDNFIIKQSGGWDISTAIIEPHKIQAISTSQYFWHKKLDLGSVILHTAGGTISFQMGNFTILKSKVNLWLYRMEKSDSNWM
nr:PH domain-containing protein [uncultured Flavobacterium sp.]